MKLPTQPGLQFHHQYFKIFIMLVNCRILSKDFLINQKIENFIKKTPFFSLQENNNNYENDQIIFWDIDTINIDVSWIKERTIKGCIILFISSVISEKTISEMFQNEYFNFAVLKKNIIYSQFVEEVSTLIDNRIQNSS